MAHKLFVFFVLFINLQVAIAAPKNLEVWFLVESTAKTSSIKKFNNDLYLHKSLPIANLDFGSSCLPMGDGCFHPQLGFIANETPAVKEENKNKEEEWKGRVFNSEDISMIDCKKEYYFDVFCGKEKKINKTKENLEVWIDNSASLKGIDVVEKSNYCHRRIFAEKLKDQCSGKVSFSVYSMSKKEISDLSVICDHVGGNDPDRLMRWIKESEANNLIVITDISEYSDKFEVFLDSIGAKYYGLDSKSIKASNLDLMIEKASKLCSIAN